VHFSGGEGGGQPFLLKITKNRQKTLSHIVFFHFFSCFFIHPPYATFFIKNKKTFIFSLGGWGLTEGQSPPDGKSRGSTSAS
jgi:hypothetical protein